MHFFSLFTKLRHFTSTCGAKMHCGFLTRLVLLLLPLFYTYYLASASVYDIEELLDVYGNNPCTITGTVADCSRLKLSYIPQLGDNITVLIFNGNELQNVTQQTFSNITRPDRLCVLKIGFSKITSISPDALDVFENLQKLDLSGNRISKQDLKYLLHSISRNENLRKLELNNMRRKTITDDTFALMNGTRLELLF